MSSEVTILLNFINMAVLASTPLLLATLGEILTEKSGNLNLGVEGMMFMGAIASLASAYHYEQAVSLAGGIPSPLIAAGIATLAAAAAGGFGALIYAFLVVTLRANQNVTGLTLTIFGTGFANFFGELIGKQAGGFVQVSAATKSMFAIIDFGALSRVPVIGSLFFQYNWMVYFGVAVMVVMSMFLNRSRVGLNLRAVGENPATADAAGVNVTRYKYMATIAGGALCGIGGMFLSMSSTACAGVWVHNSVNGYGWLAVALVIFATWSPTRAWICGLVFGGLLVVRNYYPIPGLPMQIYAMVPYIATIVVLVFASIRQVKEHAQPASCGTNYFREER
ncbi:MAG: ABC transporter permease [Candidatus Limiplasma sp.]|nr:ABC transporter permease [Candidatus Limiplasma sp.]